MSDFESVNTVVVEFDQLADLFVEMEVFSSPSELHGLLCGQLARAGSTNEQNWLVSAAAYLERERLDTLNAQTLMLDLFVQTQMQLSDSGFDLALILPDDDEELALRSESLGRWCRGFLAGIGYQGAQAGAEYSDELRETFQDLEEIVNIQDEFLDEDEAAEQDFMQVEEYVRMAAIFAFSEIHGTVDDDQDGGQGGMPRLH